MIDWPTLRIQYELFGVTVAELAEQYSVSSTMIEYIIDEQDWVQKPLAESIQRWEHKENIDETLLDEVREKMTILQTLKRSAFSSTYIALESSILSKSKAIIDNIQPNTPGAAQTLKTVVDLLQSIMTNGDKKHVEEQKKAIAINIMTVAGKEGVGHLTPIEHDNDKPTIRVHAPRLPDGAVERDTSP